MAEPAEKETITPQSLITEETVKKVLLEDKSSNAQLKSWEVVDFTKRGDNYACVVTSVQVKYEVNGQELDEVYIVKLNPRRKDDTFGDITNVVFMKEARFYLDLLPELNAVLEEVGETPLRLPRCFHSNLDSGREQIYFEDLRLRGFKMFDRKKGMDKAHAFLVLTELARLHSASLLLQDKRKESTEIKHDYLTKDWFTFTENAKDAMLPLLQGNVDSSKQMLEKIGGYERSIAWIESIKPQVEELFSDGMRNNKYDVVSHGDCWNNNILFRYDSCGEPTEVMFLDLQICRVASPAIDLNYFMYTSLIGEVRKPNLNHLLSTYYASFRKVMDAGGLEMPFSEDELRMEFREKNVFGGFFGMMAIPVLLMEPDEVPDTTSGNFEEMIQGLREKAMSMLNTNPLTKPRFLSIFDELTEIGLIP